MPDGSVASMVDSEEEGDEMFSDHDGQQGAKRTIEGKKVPGAVKLLFPLSLGDEGVEGGAMELECVWRIDWRTPW
jgi:hypothetical protein